MKSLRFLLVLSVLVVVAAHQATAGSEEGVFVDSLGVLRWAESGTEVSLFGVNYTTPFAYAYRAHKRLGLSLKKAIDLDVDQFTRLGFDAFRVHVWDREISDSIGNLLRNEHLELFDYLLSRLADRNIKIIITPIAWWGTGWPEPDMQTPGFSQRYSKPELITNEKARAAQRTYLRQFIRHVNRCRRLQYKDDPSIIAVEIINEPHHPPDADVVTGYVNEMAGVLRKAGFTKPLFYNISENWNDVQANAVSRANIDGVSFQWYPTDLVHNRMLQGNCLINVNKYAVPSAGVVGYDRHAKMVYEFDAADVGGSYMYPAMVRSFREAGMQFITMFAYDPTQIAWSNTEYPTHYLNLLYTPSKALSAMIAGKAVRQLPRLKSYGDYPENNRFGDFRVSPEEDLSEMNADSEFISSNTTRTTPRNPWSLRHIAGVGNSPLVQYDGTGAYFFDQCENGIWRLEVYPDVLWVRDPFGPTSMSREVARLFWNERRLRLTIPDLSGSYVLYPEGGGGKIGDVAGSGAHKVRPGKYIVASESVDLREVSKYLKRGRPFLDGLYTPPRAHSGMYVVDKTEPFIPREPRPQFRFQIAGPHPVKQATLFVRLAGWRGYAKIDLKNTGGFEYIPADSGRVTLSGRADYCVAVDDGRETLTFPDAIEGTPGEWDFSPEKLWHTSLVEPDQDIVLFDASRDRSDLVFPHFSRSRRYTAVGKGGENSEEVALAIGVTFSGQNAEPFGMQMNISNLVKSVHENIARGKRLIIKGRTGKDTSNTLGINLLTKQGMTFGTDFELPAQWGTVEIPLSSLKPRDGLILPESYPLFLPKRWSSGHTAHGEEIDPGEFESFQIIVDPLKSTQHRDVRETGFEIVSVVLSK